MTANARSAPAPYRGYAAQESVTGEGVTVLAESATPATPAR